MSPVQEIRSRDTSASDHTTREPDLSALVSSRICHDLISPVGAISNGVELLGGYGQSPSPELELIGDSVNSATARLRYFRIAFGATSAGASVSATEVKAATDQMFDRRFRASWRTGDTSLPRTTTKAVFLALLCLEKAAPLGGDATISLSGTTITISLAADKINARPEHWDRLAKPASTQGLTAGDVQFALLRQLCDVFGCRIKTRFAGPEAELLIENLPPV